MCVCRREQTPGTGPLQAGPGASMIRPTAHCAIWGPDVGSRPDCRDARAPFRLLRAMQQGELSEPGHGVHALAAQTLSPLDAQADQPHPHAPHHSPPLCGAWDAAYHRCSYAAPCGSTQCTPREDPPSQLGSAGGSLGGPVPAAVICAGDQRAAQLDQSLQLHVSPCLLLPGGTAQSVARCQCMGSGAAWLWFMSRPGLMCSTHAVREIIASWGPKPPFKLYQQHQRSRPQEDGHA